MESEAVSSQALSFAQDLAGLRRAGRRLRTQIEERQALRTVLVANTQLIMRALITATLAAENYEILEAGTGAEALALAGSHKPTLLILDAQIPAPDGFEVCRQIKNDRALAAMLIILVTANPADEARAAEAGTDAYLSKPFSPLDLLQTIDRLLAQWAPA